VRLATFEKDVELVGAREPVGDDAGGDVVFLLGEQNRRTRNLFSDVDMPTEIGVFWKSCGSFFGLNVSIAPVFIGFSA